MCTDRRSAHPRLLANQKLGSRHVTSATVERHLTLKVPIVYGGTILPKTSRHSQRMLLLVKRLSRLDALSASSTYRCSDLRVALLANCSRSLLALLDCLDQLSPSHNLCLVLVRWGRHTEGGLDETSLPGTDS